MVMNKQGIMRTLEAAIAIALLLGLLYVIIPDQEGSTGELPYEIRDAESFVLRTIETDDALRSCVLASREGLCSCQGVTTLLEDHTPPGYAWQCEVCETSVTCTSAQQLDIPLDKAVYTDSTLLKEGKNAKVLRVYFYER